MPEVKGPVVLLRVLGISKMTREQRQSLVRWIEMQAEWIACNYSDMADDYTARRFALLNKAREPQKESRWKRFRKWAGI